MTPEQVTILEALESSGRPWTPDGGIRAFPGGTRPIPDRLGALGGLMDKVRGTPLEYLLPFHGTLEAWGNNQQPGYLANLEAALDLAPGVGKAASAGLAGGAALGRMMSGGIDDLVRELGPLGRQAGAARSNKYYQQRGIEHVQQRRGGSDYGVTLEPHQTSPADLKKGEHKKLGDIGKALEVPAVRARENLRDVQGQQARGQAPVMQRANWEDIAGRPVITLPADYTRGGEMLDKWGGFDLGPGVSLEGGPSFSPMYQGSGVGWASMLVAARNRHNMARKLKDSYGVDPVYAFMRMGPEGSDFSTMPAETFFRMHENIPLSKSSLRKFDKAVRDYSTKTTDPVTGETKMSTFKDWAGLSEDPEKAYQQIMGMREGGSSGELRKALMSRARLSEFRDLGFPVAKDVYDAVLDPRFAGANTGDVGGLLVMSDPGAELVEGVGHQTYTHGIPGTFLGSADMAPPDQIFPDLFNLMRGEGKADAQIRRSLQMAQGSYHDPNDQAQALLRQSLGL